MVAKTEALPHQEGRARFQRAIKKELAMSSTSEQQKNIKNKLGLLNFAKALGNVSEACKWDILEIVLSLQRAIRNRWRRSFKRHF